MIHLKKLDESFSSLSGDQSELKHVWDHFSFRVEGYQFMPKYKAGIWDGYIRMYDYRKGRIPTGLATELIAFCQKNDYDLTIEDFDPPKKFVFDPEKYEKAWIADENIAYRDYQAESISHAMTHRRAVIVNPTGSGKSLVAYTLARIALKTKQRTLIVVPSVGLVKQLASDFREYSQNQEFSDSIQEIYQGQSSEAEKPIVISTWQSIYRKKPSWFKPFGFLICDEVHEFTSDCVSGVVEKCTRAHVRVGLTGTLKDTKVHKMQLLASFGSAFKPVSTKELQDRGMLADLEIRGIVIQHEKNDITKASLKYAEEMDYLCEHARRNKLITKIAGSLEGTTLVLTARVEKHAEPLFKAIQEAYPARPTYYIDGGVKGDHREDMRQEIMQDADGRAIIVATYGTYQRGINIPNIRNVIFASPSKSKVRVMQSIGRGLRKNACGSKTILVDIADDLSCGRKKKNYTLEHFVQRLNMYIDENFNVKEHIVDFTN